MRADYWTSEDRDVEIDRLHRLRVQAIEAAERTAKDHADLEYRVERARTLARVHEERVQALQGLLAAQPDIVQHLAALPVLEGPEPRQPHTRFIVEEGAEYVAITSSTEPAPVAGPRTCTLVAALAGPTEPVLALLREELVRGPWHRVSRRLAAFVVEVQAGHDVGWLLGSSTK